MRRVGAPPGSLRVLVLAAGLGLLVLSGCGAGRKELILIPELPTVGKVTIEGNEIFDDDELKAVMVLQEPSASRLFRKSRFSEAQLRTDILAVLTYYMRRGYLRARLVSREIIPRDNKVDITLTVYEGDPVTTAGVALYHVSGPTMEPLRGLGLRPERILNRLVLREGRPFDPIRLEEDRRQILDDLADEGFLLAQVRPNVQLSGDRALVFFRVDPGQRYTVDNISVSGFRAVEERYVRRDLEIHEGDTYSLSSMDKTQENLLRSGFFSYVRWDTTDVDPVERTVGLHIDVRERKMHWVEGGLGINDRAELRLTGGWGTRSVLGTGVTLAVRDRAEFDFSGDIDGIVDRNLFEVLFNQRNFLGSRWDFQPNAYWEYDQEPDYTQNILSAALTTRRYLGNRKNQLVVSLENRWVYNEADSAAVAEDPLLSRDRYQTRALVTALQRDSRNDFFYPTRGSYQRVTLELAGGALGGNNGFRKATATMGKFSHSFPSLMTFAWRVEVGSATPSGSGPAPVDYEAELLPPEDRYKLGGAYSVRGFREDELDGRRAPDQTLSGGVLEVLGNVETRFFASSLFSVVAFLDAGNVWQNGKDLALDRILPHADPDNVSPLDVRWSYGLGARVRTPVGPIRLDYARKWNIPAEFVGIEDESRWHLALGHAF